MEIRDSHLRSGPIYGCATQVRVPAAVDLSDADSYSIPIHPGTRRTRRKTGMTQGL
jgi:hypothetical protein